MPATYPFTKSTVYICTQHYGCPWTYGRTVRGHTHSEPCLPPRSFPQKIWSYWLLAANIAIGLVAVLVLTFASKYLIRAIVSGLRAVLSKPPPDKEKGPSESN